MGIESMHSGHEAATQEVYPLEHSGRVMLQIELAKRFFLSPKDNRSNRNETMTKWDQSKQRTIFNAWADELGEEQHVTLEDALAVLENSGFTPPETAH